jgi:hypothetical protein
MRLRALAALLLTHAARYRCSPRACAHHALTHARPAAPLRCASDPCAGFSVGAPFWQALPGTAAGGAWLAAVTGPSGHAVVTPVAPAVPRVRKGLAPGAPLALTPAEAQNVILEYKCVAGAYIQAYIQR